VIHCQPLIKNLKIMIGKVQFYDRIKAFGFIKTVDGNEYFFHRNDLITEDIHRGDSVDFETEQSKKYPEKVNAVKVEKVVSD